MRTAGTRAWAGRILAAASTVAMAGTAVACMNGGTPAKAKPATTGATATSGRPTAPAARPVSSDPCARSGGKYHGKIIKVFPAVGVEAGKPEYHGGGALQVWRSATCGTVWAKMIRSAENTDVATDGSAGVWSPNRDHAKVGDETFTVSRWSHESRAFRLPPHARFEVMGGYLGHRYQFEAGGKGRL